MGKLKITKVKKKLITFDKLKEGDVFEYRNDIFVKTGWVNYENHNCNAYNLTAKTFKYINSETELIDKSAELIVY